MRTLTSIALLALLLASCHHEATEYEKDTAAPAPAPTTPAAASATQASAPMAESAGVTIRRADGKELMTITEHASGEMNIAFIAADGTKRTLRGSMRESGKRKYSVEGGGVLYEVKPGDDLGFKLRMSDGKLRWKVKVAADKIKISDNEENKNPFELKTREGDRIKVVAPGDRELGNVRGGDVEDATGAKKFTATGKASAGYGVLLLDGIPELERYILVAEIEARGR